MARRHASTTIYEQMRAALAEAKASAPDALYYVSRQELGKGKRLFLKAIDELSASERERFENEYAFAIEQLLASTFEDAFRAFYVWADYNGLSKKSLGDSAFSKHYIVKVDGPQKRADFTDGYLARWRKALEATAHPDITVLTIEDPYPDNFDAFVEPLLETPWERLHTLRLALGSDFAREKGIELGAVALGEMCERWKTSLEHIHLELPKPNLITRDTTPGYELYDRRNRKELYKVLAKGLIEAILEHAPDTLREITLWNWPDDDQTLPRLLAAFPNLTRLTFLGTKGRAHLASLMQDPRRTQLEALRLGSRENLADAFDPGYVDACQPLLRELGAQRLEHWHHINSAPNGNLHGVFSWDHPWHDLLFVAQLRAAGIDATPATPHGHNAIKNLYLPDESIPVEVWRELLFKEDGPRIFKGLRSLCPPLLKLDELTLLLETLPVCFPNLERLMLNIRPLLEEGVHLPELEKAMPKLTYLNVRMRGSGRAREVELVDAILGDPELLIELDSLWLDLDSVDAHTNAVFLATHYTKLTEFTLGGFNDSRPLSDYIDSLIGSDLDKLITTESMEVRLPTIFDEGSEFARNVSRDDLPEGVRQYLIRTHLNPRRDILMTFYVDTAREFQIKGASRLRKEDLIEAIAKHLGFDLSGGS